MVDQAKEVPVNREIEVEMAALAAEPASPGPNGAWQGLTKREAFVQSVLCGLAPMRSEPGWSNLKIGEAAVTIADAALYQLAAHKLRATECVRCHQLTVSNPCDVCCGVGGVDLSVNLDGTPAQIPGEKLVPRPASPAGTHVPRPATPSNRKTGGQ